MKALKTVIATLLRIEVYFVAVKITDYVNYQTCFALLSNRFKRTAKKSLNAVFAVFKDFFYIKFKRYLNALKRFLKRSLKNGQFRQNHVKNAKKTLQSTLS